MLDLLVTLALVVSPATASPSPTPAPASTLRTIAHVRSTQLCAQFAAHANSAIDATTRNDGTIGVLLSSLKSTDMDTNGIAWRNDVQHFNTLADTITKAWKDGEQEVGQLRKLADTTADPAEKKALSDSADALGGALWRKRLIARDLDGFVSYLYANQMATTTEAQSQANEMTLGVKDPMNDHTLSDSPSIQDAYRRDLAARPADTLPFPGAKNNPKDGELAASAYRDFSTRVPSIVQDEIQAASRIETAAEGC